jgi:hypothetical protein
VFEKVTHEVVAVLFSDAICALLDPGLCSCGVAGICAYRLGNVALLAAVLKPVTVATMSVKLTPRFDEAAHVAALLF